MPKITDDAMEQKGLATSHYGYSATRLDNLGSYKYTLCSIVRDVSGSVDLFATELEKCTQAAVQGCQRSPEADSLMVRVVDFNSFMSELHGFKLLEACNLADYGGLSPHGGTACYDAVVNSVEASTDYARELRANDFSVNGIMFVLTDGDDNMSKLTVKEVQRVFREAVTQETLESFLAILVAVNVKDPMIKAKLEQFNRDAGFSGYIEIEKADEKSLAKLAKYIEQSTSSQSQALGTGGPSQVLTF